MLYTVGEMAKATGIPASTLRYYDNQGLLPFVERSAGGVRMFTERALSAITIIECLKKSGLSLKEIRAYQDMIAEGDASLEGRLKLFEDRRMAIREQVKQLEDTLAVLDFKCWYYETACKAGTEDVVRDLDNVKVPKKHARAREILDGKA